MAKKQVKKEKKAGYSNSFVGFFSKLKNLYFHPKQFLNSIEGEKKYEPILKTFISFYLIFALITIIINFLSGIVNIYQAVLGFIWSIIYGSILIFGLSFVVHLGVKIFRGRQGYFNTYKPFSYALIIWIIYSFITLIAGFIAPFDAAMLQGIGTATTQQEIIELYKSFISQPGAIINSIIGLVALIHAFIFSVMGISKFQKISKARVILSIILSWIVVFIVWVLILIIIGLANQNLVAAG